MSMTVRLGVGVSVNVAVIIGVIVGVVVTVITCWTVSAGMILVVRFGINAVFSIDVNLDLSVGMRRVQV